jgi:hypothetical protein
VRRTLCSLYHLCRHPAPPPSRWDPLQLAVTDMSHLLHRIGRLGDVFAGFQCVEIDSIATVLAVGDEPDVAAFIVARHAEADDENSDHHAHLRKLIEQHDSLSPVVLQAARHYVATLTITA